MLYLSSQVLYRVGYCNVVLVIKNNSIFVFAPQVNPSGHTLTSEKVLHQFQILSFAEVMCTFSFPSSSYAAYVIDLTNDGSIFSANRIPYVIYDSKCLNCSSSLSTPPVCSIQVRIETSFLGLIVRVFQHVCHLKNYLGTQSKHYLQLSSVQFISVHFSSVHILFDISLHAIK